jgi:hypothetical protein
MTASVMTPNRQIQKTPVQARAQGTKLQRYSVVFYDSPAAAKHDLEKLRGLRSEVDVLNIVIRAEPPFDDSDLTPIGKVFAGAAWTLIHERRKADGWYDKPQE